MSDKAKRSHIETLVYVAPTVKPGDSIRYGSWKENEHAAKRCGACYGNGTVRDNSWRDVRCDVCRGSGRVEPLPLTIIKRATGSDYSGDLVEKSNARVLKRMFPWLVEIRGGHGTEGLGYLGKRENQNDALIEAIDSITVYPILDDDDHSELETELEWKAWLDYGRREFADALKTVLDALDPDYEHDAQDAACVFSAPEGSQSPLDEIWHAGCAAYNVNGGTGFVNEQGDSIHFYIDEWIEGAQETENARYPWGEWTRGTRAALHEQLNALAQACRVIDVPEADLLVARDAFFSGRDEWRTIVDERWHVALIERWESENNQPTEQP